MKRFLLAGLCAGLLSVNIASAAVMYEPPNGGNINFYPLMQQQFEQQETLDFADKPEQYKERREAKDKQSNIVKQKLNSSPYYQAGFGNYSRQARPATGGMRFVKDADGNIRIQSVNQPYANTIRSTVQTTVENGTNNAE